MDTESSRLIIQMYCECLVWSINFNMYVRFDSLCGFQLNLLHLQLPVLVLACLGYGVIHYYYYDDDDVTHFIIYCYDIINY